MLKTLAYKAAQIMADQCLLYKAIFTFMIVIETKILYFKG